MRPPTKAIQPLIVIASNVETTVDQLLEAMSRVDRDLLQRNAFHVLNAIPDTNLARGTVKFAAVHHTLGSESAIFAMLADTCVRGEMEDAQAHAALKFMLDKQWLNLASGLLVSAWAQGKRICAEWLASRGLYDRNDWDWHYWLRNMTDAQALEMAKTWIDLVKPERGDLIALRAAARQDSAIAGFLDRHLGIPAPAARVQ